MDDFICPALCTEGCHGGTHDICALHIRLKAFDAVALYTSRLLRKYAYFLDDIRMQDDYLGLCPHHLSVEGDPSARPRAENGRERSPSCGYELNFATFQA